VRRVLHAQIVTDAEDTVNDLSFESECYESILRLNRDFQREPQFAFPIDPSPQRLLLKVQHWPPKSSPPDQPELLRLAFVNLVDRRHPLVRLAGLIDWDRFATAFGPLYRLGG
jgi:hypothetical protein